MNRYPSSAYRPMFGQVGAPTIPSECSNVPGFAEAMAWCEDQSAAAADARFPAGTDDWFSVYEQSMAACVPVIVNEYCNKPATTLPEIAITATPPGTGTGGATTPTTPGGEGTPTTPVTNTDTSKKSSVLTWVLGASAVALAGVAVWSLARPKANPIETLADVHTRTGEAMRLAKQLQASGPQGRCFASVRTYLGTVSLRGVDGHWNRHAIKEPRIEFHFEPRWGSGKSPSTHSLSVLESSDARIMAHWQGFCENHGCSQVEANPVDNTWGSGYLPLPKKLLHLRRYSDAFDPRKLEHKAWPARSNQPETHMITVPVDNKLSVMRLDMESLLRLGLARIQSNAPGTLSFYFIA